MPSSFSSPALELVKAEVSKLKVRHLGTSSSTKLSGSHISESCQGAHSSCERISGLQHFEAFQIIDVFGQS